MALEGVGMSGIYNTDLIFFVSGLCLRNLRYGNDKFQKSPLRQLRH